MDNKPISNTVVQVHDVVQATGLSKKTLLRLEAAGEFPSRVQLSNRISGWIASEVQQWIETRPRVA